MKKQLLSIAMVCSAFFATSQTLLTENFNSLTTGDLGTNITGAVAGQNGWKTYAPNGTANSFATVTNVGTNDNSLAISGSTTSTGTRYVYKSIAWANRTSGNDVLFATFDLNTGALSSSKNEFRFALMNAKQRVIAGFGYTKSTKALTAIAYDSTFNSTVTGSISGTTLTLTGYSGPNLPAFNLISGAGITAGTYIISGSGSTYTVSTSQTVASTSIQVYDSGNYPYNLGASNAVLTLGDDKNYSLGIIFEKSTGKITFFGGESTSPTLLFDVFINQNTKTNDFSELDLYVRAGTSNANSGVASFDNISLVAQSCAFYENPEFTYPNTSHCKTGANVSATLKDNTVTGTFTSTTGLVFANATTGEVNLAQSTLGTYRIKFTSNASQTACSDTASVLFTVSNCAGLNEVTENKFSIYPNPANDIVTVTLSDLVITEGTIKLTSADGKLIEAREFNNSSIETFDVKSLKAGIYFFQIGNTTEKVIIK